MFSGCPVERELIMFNAKETVQRLINTVKKADEKRALELFAQLTEAQKAEVIEELRDKVFVRNLFRQRAQYRAYVRIK